MIDLFGEPQTKPFEGKEITVTLNARELDPHTQLMYSGFEPMTDLMFMVASRLSEPKVAYSYNKDDRVAVLSYGELGRATPGPHTLWGCQVFEPANSGTVIPACVTGPLTCEKLGIPARENYFDARAMLPWAFGIRRGQPDGTALLVPGPLDEPKLAPHYETLRSSGFKILPSGTGLRETCLAMSTANFVVTSSVTAYIMAEAMGVPCTAFWYFDQTVPNRLNDYVLGTKRELPEILDFNRSVRISVMPHQPKPAFALDYALDTCPFSIMDGEPLRRYFNEA